MIDLNKFIAPEEPQSPGASNIVAMLMQYLQQSQGMQNPQQPSVSAQQGLMPGEMPDEQQSRLGQGRMMPSAQGAQSWGELKKLAEATFPGNATLQKVALAQIGLESGGPGNMSQLGKQNNLFGIKGAGVRMPTMEDYGNGLQRVTESFSTNNSPLASFMQYRDLLNKPRYADVVSANSPEQAFQALQNAGYATDPKYAQKLSGVYNTKINPLFGE